MTKRMKWMAGMTLILLIAGYSIYAYVKPLKAEVMIVQPQTVSQSFTEEGLVAAATERPVFSQIPGKAVTIHVQEGQKVKKGTPLVEIDTQDLTYQLQQLEAQKKSLLGQQKKSIQDMQQQLGQLKGQLESIQGQEAQAYKKPYDAQIRQQQLMIEEAQHQLEMSQADFNRIRALFDRGAVSKMDLDHARNQVDQLKNTLQQQQQALNLIQEQANPLPGTAEYFDGLKKAVQTQIDILNYELNADSNGTEGSKQYYQGLFESVDVQIQHLNEQLANSKTISPIDGIVKQVNIKEGAMVTTQSPLLTLISDGDFEVNVYILTEDVVHVKEGMHVNLIQKRKDGDYTFDGTVKGIAPAAEEKVSALGLTQHKVKVTITPGEKAPEVRPGYALDVQFITMKQPNKLVVPIEALFPYENGDALWVVQDGKAVIRKVQKGMETNDQVVIEKGLNPGDHVIKNAHQDGLKVGERIQ